MKISVEYKNNNFTVLPEIIEAKYVDNYNVELTFSDAVKKTVDFGAFLKNNPHPQYNQYNRLENFKKFKLENGNIVWGKNWDLIFPIEQLYKGKIKF